MSAAATAVSNPFTSWDGILNAWQVNVATGARVLRTSAAAEKVVAARGEIMRAAIASPATADYGELARMGFEKAMAFAQSFEVIMRACLGVQSVWWRQAEVASRMMTSSRTPTVTELASLMSDAMQMALINARTGARAGRDALAPIARVVADNAKRLS